MRTPFRTRAFSAPIAAAGFLGGVLAALPAQAQISDCAWKVGTGKPCLKITIPTVVFTQETRTDNGDTTTISVPYLAEYISGIYQYGVYAAIICAGVMAIIGGFEWLTGGDSGRVAHGKERIEHAVIGMLLVLGTYVILSTVNPEIVKLKGLNINVIKSIPLDDNLMKSTDETSVSDEQSLSPRTRSFAGGCPIQLTEQETAGKANPARISEFLAKIGPSITATTVTDKVLQAGDAAVACGINLGSCGTSAATLKGLAMGANMATCTSVSAHWGECYGAEKNYIGKEAQTEIMTYRCLDNGPATSGCTTDSKEAAKKAYDYLKAKNIAGWPDTWADSLVPGDVVFVYNGNGSGPGQAGTHSAIVSGKSADGKSIEVIHGSAKRAVKISSICVKSTCDSPEALVRVFHSQ